ncbi:CsoS2 family carboxysome shell protein [Thiorhodovibrio winogradskyi]|nr:CsoS2 family carboxysome shell protein [Thiorhodovibrio winogradskyi]
MASKANLKTSGREAALARRRALSTGGKSKAHSAAAERSRGDSARQRANSGASHSVAPSAAPAGGARRPAAPVAATPAAIPAAIPEPSFGWSRPTQNPTPRASGARTRPPAGRASVARARREALSRQGRRAVKAGDRVRADVLAQQSAAQPSNPARAGASAAPSPQQRHSVAEQTLGQLSAKADVKPGNGSARIGAGARLGSKPGNGSRLSRRDNGLGTKPTGRMLSLARRAAQSGRGKAATNAPTSAASLARQANPKLSGRELSQRVRAQRSHSGGAGERKSAPAGRIRPNATARGAEDQYWKVGVSETAAGQTVTGTRVGRSVKTTGDEPSTCRAVTGTEYMGADIFREFCHSEPPRNVPKVGVSPSALGNRITGNEVGRSSRVTGDEPGSCERVTGTEYLSPAHFEAFCDIRAGSGLSGSDASRSSGRRTGLTATQGGQSVSGTMVGRPYVGHSAAESSVRVTGDEQGAGVKTTGTQYTNVQSIAEGIPAHQGGGRSAVAPSQRNVPAKKAVAERMGQQAGSRVPPKVAVSSTLAGGRVTGTLVGRSAQVTGDEPGSCRSVTGDEYLSSEQFETFCNTRPEPEASKVGESLTALGKRVSGTQTGRSGRVTGDEPGTCKAVTGTPYAGMEQVAEYCAPAAAQAARERMLPMARRGAGMTGRGPGIGGAMTGDRRGACEPLTGTPYHGADQQAAACADGGPMQIGAGALAATPDEPDFPQALTGAPWQQFSVNSPARQADHQRAARTGAVTGTNSEGGGRITGPFGMATGKITGTEEFRFGAGSHGRRAEARAVVPEGKPATPSGNRVTGEGQSAGLKITGDDWERGERVTGTEGAWAKGRNPTRPGPMSAMQPPERKRNEETPVPVSRVTGSSGSTDRGSLITYSGGARG